MQYERVTWRVAAAVLLALCIPAGAQTTQDVIPITADDDVYAVLSAATGTEHFMLDGPEGPAAHDDAGDTVTYTLTDTLVVTADMSPLTIEGSPVTSSGTRDLVWPHQVILEGPDLGAQRGRGQAQLLRGPGQAALTRDLPEVAEVVVVEVRVHGPG